MIRLRYLPRVMVGPAGPCLLAVVFVLGIVLAGYDRTTGFTSLIRFGEKFTEQRLPQLSGEPLRIYAGDGYDGQFYAQLAINPDVREPTVQAALDNPTYRARRILFPAVVHGLTGGQPRAALTLYALANVAVWLTLGWLLWRRLANEGWHGTGVWLACMLGIGALDSVRLSLVDLPAMLLVFLATESLVRGRRVSGAVALAAASLTRETSLLAAAIPVTGDLRAPRTWWRHVATGAIIVLPLVGWTLWLSRQVVTGNTTGGGNFSLPGVAMLQHFITCSRELASGNFDSRYSFGLLAVISFTWQAIYLLRRARGPLSPWLRVGLPFAVFYFFIGAAAWHGYWAVARTCLPLTFAFNLLLARDRFFWWHLGLGNLCTLHAAYRILPD